ncbi:hypothetical protein [Lentisalinibacter sediminis]
MTLSVPRRATITNCAAQSRREVRIEQVRLTGQAALDIPVSHVER